MLKTFALVSTLVLATACSQPATAPLSGEALIARGDYLVNSVVLCGDCHTPMTAQGHDLTRRLQADPT